jgi:ketosteroid isomerase-like protein
VHPNVKIAREWLRAFNARELDALLSLYADDAVHVSPKLRVRRPETEGKVRGKAALREWWRDSFERLPGLRYEEITLTADDQRVFMEYLRKAPNEADFVVAEVLDVTNGKITGSRVYHG